MDSEFAERNNDFVRLDVAALAFILFLGSVISFVTGRIGLGLNLATTAFIIVGVSVAYIWRKELLKEDIIELNPFMGILSGGVAIGILQVFTGLVVFKYGILPSLIYGIISALGYDSIVFAVALIGMPSEYKARRHPKTQYTDETDPTMYVFETNKYISLVEKYATQADPDKDDYNIPSYRDETESNTQHTD